MKLLKFNILVVIFTAMGLSAPNVMAANINDSLLFKLTQPEGLFGPGKAVNEDVFPIKNLYSKQVGPVTKGDIVTVDQDVPVEVLQDAWNQALTTCKNYSHTVHYSDACSNVTIRPTENECITGKIGSRKLKFSCCTWGDDYSNGCTYPGAVSKTYTVKINKQLPVAIGDYPTQPLPKKTDIGAKITYQADVDVGLEVSFRQNAGSVDVRYATDVNLSTSRDRASAGDVIQLTARHSPNPAETKMQSEFPSLDLAFQYFYKVYADADLEWANMDSKGEQARGKTKLFHLDTADDPNADEQGRLVGELVSSKVGVSGVEVAFMRNVPYAPPNTRDRVWRFPLTYSWDITNPFACPPVPLVGGNPCDLYSSGISYDLAEILMRTPDVDTPVSDNHDAGLNDFNGVPLNAVTNQILPDGSIRNTSPSGWRPLSAGLLGDINDIDLKNLPVNDGSLSNDFARLDLDVDGLVTTATGVPFGFNFSSGVKTIPLSGSVSAPVPSLDGEINALDLDIVNWFSIDEELVFTPNLIIVMNFNKPVEVRRDANSSWQTVQQYEWPVFADRDSHLQLKMPVGGVTITPTYSLRNNKFSNNMYWQYTTGSQTTYFQAKLEGFLATISDITGLPANFAIHQSTLASSPIQMGDTGSTYYSFDHFTDQTGGDIRIAELPSGSSGSSGGNSGGANTGNTSNSSTSNSGGGCSYNPAGRFDPLLPLMILLSGLYLWRRHRWNLSNS